MKRRKTVIEFHSKTDRADFQRMRSLLTCLSTDATRPVLHNVLVETVEDGVQLTATDGKRLRSDRFDLDVSPGLYALKGTGSRFVLWASAALGCRLDPSVIALADHEAVMLYIQKDRPELSPAVLQNDRTTVVVMPFRVTEPWVHELEEIRKAA